MRGKNRVFHLISVMLLLSLFLSRGKSPGGQTGEAFQYKSFRTEQRTVSFYDINVNIIGFSALFCEWLSSLFDIPFKPAVLVQDKRKDCYV